MHAASRVTGSGYTGNSKKHCASFMIKRFLCENVYIVPLFCVGTNLFQIENVFQYILFSQAAKICMLSNQRIALMGMDTVMSR